MGARRVVAAAAAAGCVLAGLLTSGATAADPASYTIRPSVNQVYVLGATPGAGLQLVHDGAVVESGTVDSMGSLVWRQLDAGTYSVRGEGSESGPVTVSDFDGPPPPQSFYSGQSLGSGFGYITTRDGTTLSANVSLPPGDGPFPTVVEYSGYDPSNPANTTFAQLFNTLGFAYVGVNVRGTGCSGGSFMTFEPVQSIDGYDVIETVAAQPWVAGKVGMVGISYPGIEQLYVARTQPPDLAAITPLSVIDDTYRSTLYPGGILNTGFAVPWASERAEQAAPYGQPWSKQRADDGDTECADNQQVRLQNVDLGALIDANPFYDPEIGDPINPSVWAKDIDVPVFIAGAWQDEQTGGHWPQLLDDLTGSPHVYASMVNGSHAESLSLGIFGRYADFLDLYVAHRVPGNAKGFVAPILSQSITGISGLHLPPGINYGGMTYRQALRTYESQKPVRVLFEEGAAAGQPAGSPLPRFVRTFDAWPIPQATTKAWYLGSQGRLRGKPSPLAEGSVPERSYVADPSVLPATTHNGNGDGLWGPNPTYDWRQIPDGYGLGWITPPLRRTAVAIGTGSVDLWIRSTAPDTDLEVTLTEVRPDGTEVYVQSGWLRASHRALDKAESTPTSPVHTDLAADAAELPDGQYVKARVALYPFAQVFRPGSRLRITVDAPGDSKPQWAFDTTVSHGERVWVATDRDHRSRLVLPLVPGVKVPAAAPDCASLRSQPCRTYP